MLKNRKWKSAEGRGGIDDISGDMVVIYKNGCCCLTQPTNNRCAENVVFVGNPSILTENIHVEWDKGSRSGNVP
jgi:hypothetical protein